MVRPRNLMFSQMYEKSQATLTQFLQRRRAIIDTVNDVRRSTDNFILMRKIEFFVVGMCILFIFLLEVM
ncbi:hypothetical protein Trydic_g22995 [Trypoxylus dichotomus]